MRTVVSGGTCLTPNERLPGWSVVVEHGRIVAMTSRPPGRVEGEQRLDATDHWVIPGLVDIHTHGGDGHDTMDATEDAIDGIGRFLARHGVTAYLPTTVAAPADATVAAIRNVRESQPPDDGARHLGIHLEGPYLEPDQGGAQPIKHLRLPRRDEYGAWLEEDVVRLATIAPELERGLEFVRTATAANVRTAVGHTAASDDDVRRAADLGLDQATHLFNGMAPLHHREPGAVGAVLTDDRIAAQLIVDGVHVHPTVVDLAIRLKGVERTILVSDAMRAAGLADGAYDLGGRAVVVTNGMPRTPSGRLAGSSLTLDVAIRNVREFTGRPLTDCVAMATASPATAMGWQDRGRLAPGFVGDITVLDENLHVVMTLVEGRVVYERDAERGA